MNDRDLLLMARTLFGELSLSMDEGRAQDLSRDASSLRQRISSVSARLAFDHLPGDFRLVLQSERFPPPSPPTAGEYAEAAALPKDGDVTQLDLVGAAEAVRRGDVSSRELVSACVARIERLQPRLNCFIEVEAEAALAAADRADAERVRGGAKGRLHGVPLAHKDMFYRSGVRCTCGSTIRKNFRADTTATVLSRLDAEGAITLGALNMVQFAAGGTGHNGTFGDCRNPWNTDYSPGGSSSGSGTAVAARLVYGSLGSDTGGSVRLPAAMCGVVGLKPTRGRISCHGIMPRSWTTDVVGPLTRTARDCARLLTVLAGPDPMDPDCADIPTADYEAPL
jgi:aspartyl-tRNA(Asn)/glutamyl-tRNA(Gln) amidotransferase subunit A